MSTQAKLRLAEDAYIQRTLGGKVICDRCGTTLDTYADVCSAQLDDPCPGFRAIDDAKTDFWRISHDTLNRAACLPRNMRGGRRDTGGGMKRTKESFACHR